MKNMVPLYPAEIPTHLRMVPAVVVGLSFALCGVYIKGPPGYRGIVERYGEGVIRKVQEGCFMGVEGGKVAMVMKDREKFMALYIGGAVFLILGFLVLALRQRRGEKHEAGYRDGKKMKRWAASHGAPWMVVGMQFLALALTVYWFYRLQAYYEMMREVMDKVEGDGEEMEWGLGQFLAVFAWAPLLWTTAEGVLSMVPRSEMWGCAGADDA